MNNKLIKEIQHGMVGVLDQRQQEMLKAVMLRCLEGYEVKEKKENRIKQRRELSLIGLVYLIKECRGLFRKDA